MDETLLVGYLSGISLVLGIILALSTNVIKSERYRQFVSSTLAPVFGIGFVLLLVLYLLMYYL